MRKGVIDLNLYQNTPKELLVGQVAILAGLSVFFLLLYSSINLFKKITAVISCSAKIVFHILRFRRGISRGIKHSGYVLSASLQAYPYHICSCVTLIAIVILLNFSSSK